MPTTLLCVILVLTFGCILIIGIRKSKIEHYRTTFDEVLDNKCKTTDNHDYGKDFNFNYEQS